MARSKVLAGHRVGHGFPHSKIGKRQLYGARVMRGVSLQSVAKSASGILHSKSSEPMVSLQLYQIELGLLVGVGGDFPNEEADGFGEVVISKPHEVMVDCLPPSRQVPRRLTLRSGINILSGVMP
jgi:hypothetical protein